ncbi:hypothetical protein [Streptomyces acidicola]|uniref:hypothetical protein n=1 Tax=Streptomyces acidicola TaxID=2596892 RepID=UPI0034183BE7
MTSGAGKAELSVRFRQLADQAVSLMTSDPATAVDPGQVQHWRVLFSAEAQEVLRRWDILNQRPDEVDSATLVEWIEFAENDALLGENGPKFLA